ncbi:MAG: hypothetical protein ACLQLC_06950 [Candidatus Sulfotelmatobacter sp.]
MTTHQILPAVPKRSTSSRCTTGDGGFVPWRTQDAKEYRERMAQITAPTPTEVAANRWLEYERSWERRIKESDERQRADMRKRIQRDEQAAKELKERQEKQADYKRRELMLTRLMDSYNLSTAQRAVVNRKLVASKDATDLVLAEMTIQEILASPQPVEASGDAGLDWRSALKVTEKK